ncbi:DUF4300 family protein [Streptococcus suis]|uniref:DUF4300 family protein n=1 Tax=Streptococcus suis TaxID=1307 RepID=UPI003D766EB0
MVMAFLLDMLGLCWKAQGTTICRKTILSEPYQAIYFSSKDQVYDYLLKKYALDCGQETAPTFIVI